jgi:hypothetical protein
MDFENMPQDAIDLIIKNNIRMFEEHGYNPEGLVTATGELHADVQKSELKSLVKSAGLEVQGADGHEKASATLAALESLSRLSEIEDEIEVDLDTPVMPHPKGPSQD